MRVDPNLSSILGAGIQSTAQTLQTSVEQMSSGLRVATPSDDPYAAAANLRSLAASANVDSYTKSSQSVLALTQTADSALSSVVGQLTQALSLGTQAGNSTISASDRSVLVGQVQSALQQVVALANTKYGGVSLFAGTSSAGTAFVADSASSTGYTYKGNDGTNHATVGDSLQVQTNIPGDQIFTSPNGNVLGSLSQLATAVQSGSAADLANATAAVSSAISYIGQQRSVYAGVTNQVNAQDSFLSQETITLSSQQQSLTGVDMSTAIQNLTQAETAHSAVLAAAAKVLPTNLLNYLSPAG
jgi:flagellar hook-associated protein 3 FlgL